MRRLLIIALLSLPITACDQIRKLPGMGKDTTPPQQSAEPADYTITGVTKSNFDLVPVRVAGSVVTVRVNRQKTPEPGWRDCDQFEVYFSTKGTGGGYVKFLFLNLTVGGASFPVAPTGTEYTIESRLIKP